MKPTDKQKAVCDLIIAEAKFWQSTNDITSPSHGCEISTDLSNMVLNEEITDDEAELLEEAIRNLYYTIRNLK